MRDRGEDCQICGRVYGMYDHAAQAVFTARTLEDNALKQNWRGLKLLTALVAKAHSEAIIERYSAGERGRCDIATPAQAQACAQAQAPTPPPAERVVVRSTEYFS